MSIKKRLDGDLKEAMKAREQARVSCIRMLKSKLLEREVALRGKHGLDYEITDEEALAVIASYAKQRRDSIESFRRGDGTISLRPRRPSWRSSVVTCRSKSRATTCVS